MNDHEIGPGLAETLRREIVEVEDRLRSAKGFMRLRLRRRRRVLRTRLADAMQDIRW